MRRRALLLWLPLVLLLGLAPGAEAAPACTITWTGGAVPPSSSWSKAANWDLARVPAAGDAVCVPGATSEPVVDAPFTVASVQAAVPVAVKSTLTLTDTVDASAFTDVDLSSGALNSLGTAAIAGTLKWTGGDLGGDGGTTQVASASIAAAADVHIQAGHTLRTAGPVTWSAGAIRMAGGARWVNEATATAMTNGLVVSPTGLGVTPLPQLVNAGTFTTAAGAGPAGAVVQTSVINSGTMSAAGAPLQLAGNYGATTSSSGLLSGLQISQTLVPLDGAQLTGDTVQGAMSVPAGAHAGATDLTLNAPSSTTFGGDGTLTVAGTLAWQSGTATGNLGIVTAPGSTLSVGSARLSGASRLETDGTTTFTGSMLMLGDASWTNRGTVVLGSGTELSSDPGFGGTELELLNLGTISQTSASTTFLGGVLNDGTIAIDRGNLHIDYLHGTSDSTIAIGIAGSAPGTGYGTLTAFGGLAGTLHVAVDPAYAPAPGTQFNVVSTGPAPDDPFRLTGLDLGSRGTLTPAWTTSGSLELTAAAASGGLPSGAMRRLALPLTAFALAAAPAPARADDMLKVADLQTGVVTTLASGARAWSSLGWHADGSLTATASGRAIYAYSPGTPLARLRHVTDAELSPAGDRIAAESRSGRLVIRGLDGRLIGARGFRGQLTSLAWSRDGSHLAAGWFDHRLRGHITVLGRRGFALRTVRAPGDVRFSSAAWAPDGHSLAYAARPDDRGRPAQIRRLDVATGAQTVLLRGDRCSPPPLGVCELLEPPVVAPDGVHVALVRDLNAVTVLAPGAPPQAFRVMSQRDGVLAAAWTPDGTALVVAYAQADRAHLAVAPLSGTPRTVADLGHMSVHDLTVSADGSHAALAGTDDIDF